MSDEEPSARTPSEWMTRRLAAILSADVKGYSRLMGEDEEATIRTLTAYRQSIAALIEHHRGRVVDSPGDNLLAEFASVVDAVRCAVVIQRDLRAKNAGVPDRRKMEFRIGINLGDVITEEGRLYGDGVNIAARLEGLADAGGICISEAAYTQVKNKLALGYTYIGEQQVKNIAEPVRAYKVVIDSDTTATSVPSQAPPAQPHPTEQPPSRPWLRVTVAAVILLVVGAGGLVFRHFYARSSPPSAPVFVKEASSLPLPDKPSIVVLPFTNMSEDPKQDYFSDGITEDITTDLSRISGLFVIARNSAFTYKGKAVKVQDVSREMGVRYVLEGSVRKSDNRVRVTAQLIDGPSGGHAWSERYDRPLKDIFAVQDEIVQQLVTTLRVEVQEAEQARVRRVPTENLNAYEVLLRGREYFSRFTKEAAAQARQMYEKAIALDSQYAAAYAALGLTYWVEWALQWSEDPQSLERAAELAQKAVTLDDSLPGAHRLLGYVSLWKNRQHDLAIAEGERDLALDPNNAEGYVTLANILTFAGRPEEAIGLLEKGMRLNPRAPNYWFYLFELGHAYHWLGQTEKAIALQKRVLLLNPNNFVAHLELATIYDELGREEEARAEVAEALKLNPVYSLEALRERHPYKDPAALERTIEALRKAGLK